MRADRLYAVVAAAAFVAMLAGLLCGGSTGG